MLWEKEMVFRDIRTHLHSGIIMQIRIILIILHIKLIAIITQINVIPTMLRIKIVEIMAANNLVIESSFISVGGFFFFDYVK